MQRFLITRISEQQQSARVKLAINKQSLPSSHAPAKPSFRFNGRSCRLRRRELLDFGSWHPKEDAQISDQDERRKSRHGRFLVQQICLGTGTRKR